MFLALLNNKLVSPTNNREARCPLCKAEVIAKRGDINIHHWAHKKREDCDSWTEPETYWHKSWKESFPIQSREFVFERNGKKHFADVYTDAKIVIELQNSSISSKTIEERETFYGKRMLWVINGGRFRERISFLIDAEAIKLVEGEDYRFSSNYIKLSHNKISEYLETQKEFHFQWENPIRSWKNAKRPVFIDFNENHILWFHDGIGENSGKFRVFSKKQFFEKYKGSYEKYKLLNCNKNLFFYKDAVNIINDLLPGYFDVEREVTYEFLGFKEYKYKIIDESFKYTTYKHPPYLSLKVYDNFSTKTFLQKARLKDFVIPNSNNKGLIFLFCYGKNSDKVGLHISSTFEMSIGKKVLELIEKGSKEFKYKMNREWTIDYIASIPLNFNDIKQLANTIVSYITKEITNKEESNIEII